LSDIVNVPDAVHPLEVVRCSAIKTTLATSYAVIY